MTSALQKSKAAQQKPARPAPTKRSKPRTGIGPSTLPAMQSTGLPWTFLTNHAHVLVLLSRSPSRVLREVALQVGITERAVQRIIADLEAGGIIERQKIGRQNHYLIRSDQPLRHPVESHRTVADLLDILS